MRNSTAQEDARYRLSSTDAANMARAAGLVVDFPDEFTLQLDIDSVEAERRMKDLLCLLAEKVGETVVLKETVSRGGHKHVRVTLPFVVTALERVALQACLGSDPKRELLSVFELRAGDKTPTVFFENPGFDTPGLYLAPIDCIWGAEFCNVSACATHGKKAAWSGNYQRGNF